VKKDTVQILAANFSAFGFSLSDAHEILQVLTMGTALVFTLYKFCLLYKKEKSKARK